MRAPLLLVPTVTAGVGVPEPNNPHSPDESGSVRAADGLLATSHIFLHGTSAGSIGAFSVAYVLEREGLRLSGIVMDSHVMSEAFEELVAGGCSPYDTALVRLKIGPLTDGEHLPDHVVGRGDVTVPMLHIWSRGDPSCCGEDPFTYVGEDGTEHEMGSCDYHHEALRAAIEDRPPGGSSESLRLCVNDAATSTPGACNMHSPTKIAYDEVVPPGDQDRGGLDYNAEIADWVTARLEEPAPP